MEHNSHITLTATTPSEITSIRAGASTSPFGNCLIGETPHGICHLSFFDDGNQDIAIAEMKVVWPFAEVSWDHARAAQLSANFFPPAPKPVAPIKLVVHGTPFQLQIWRALLRVPTGALVSYGALATAAGFPKAARAVGSAVGRNAISFLIPCHRVIRADGKPGQYRWGAIRKRAMIAWEDLENKKAK